MTNLRGCTLVLGLFLLGPSQLPADQYVVMSTGARLRIDRHVDEGPYTNLFLVGGGMVQVNSVDIQRYEADEYVPPAPAPPERRAGAPALPVDLDSIVRTSSQRHGLDPDLIQSVIRAESGGDMRAVSVKGASGLMQLMPGTARMLNVSDVFDPAQNVEAGTQYLRELLELYHDDLALALAAYNAGPQKVSSSKGIPPYRETREYISRVIRTFNRKKTAQASQTSQ